MEKKKIAIIHESMVTGGVEKALIHLLKYLDYTKYEVTVWLKDDKGPLRNQMDPRAEVKYWGTCLQKDYKRELKNDIRQGKLLKAADRIGCRGLSRFFVNDWYRNLKYYIKSMQPADAPRYDVAISYQSLNKEEVMVLSYFFKAGKKVGWIHGDCKFHADEFYDRYFLKEYRKMDAVFCVSEAVKRIFVSKYPELKRRVKTFYNLQDYAEIIRLSEKPVEWNTEQITLVTVGRLSKEKGQEMIPYIAEKLSRKGYSFVWYLVGDGKEKRKIQQEIQELKMENNVILLGNKRNPYPYIKQCSIYVQPSYVEGFCLATFEAKILKKVIVLTDVPGMREQFREKEAVFCSASVESILQGIECAIKEPPVISEMNEGVMKKYNQEQMQKLYQVIEE